MAAKNSNTNTEKKENQPKPQLRISQSKDWTDDGIKVTINVMLIADRTENVNGREVAFYNPSNHNTLKRIVTSTRGKASYSYTIPINELKNNTKRKIGIKVNSRVGTGTKAIEKYIFEEVEVEHGLPAGGFLKGCKAFRIRLDKHLKDFFIAAALITAFVLYALNAGNLGFSLGTALVTVLIFGLWWKKTKSIFRTSVCAIMLFAAMLSLVFNPQTFSMPLIRGVIMSLLIGMPFYVAEEIWRKPDGSSMINFYPLWPVIICLLVILGLVFNSLGAFLPEVNEVSILVQNANLLTESRWSFLNHIPFLGNVDFEHIASNIDWIVSLFTAGTLILFWGGWSDLKDMYNSVKGGVTPDLDAGGFAGILAILKQVWDFFRDAILPIIGLRKGGKR